MVFSVALGVVTLALAQPGETDPGPSAIRFVRGQELVYRGTVREETTVGGSVGRRTYDFESHTFLLEVKDGRASIAFQTVIRSAGNDKSGSVRLELAEIGPDGKASFANGESVLPTVGTPPTFEPAGFVGLLHGQHPVEHVQGVRCVRFSRTAAVVGGTQRETAWVAVQTGVVRKLERTFERFSSGTPTMSQTIALAYELASEVVVPDALSAGRRREIRLAVQEQQRLTAILPTAGRVGPRAFERVLFSLANHVESQPATPYRPAVLWLQSRAEAGKRSDTPAPARIP